MQCSTPAVERARPLLGTLVSARVHGLACSVAAAALEQGFAEVARIHRCMSFQESGSDVSRLNREGHRHPVAVDARTRQVLHRAAEVSAASEGAFDITVAPQVVAAQTAPPPPGAPVPDPAARWTDVKLLPDGRVKFARPLWIDLSGIAKGYAVDRFIHLLSPFAPTQACVNAGGEIRISGAEAEWVRLGHGCRNERSIPAVELHDGAIASSGWRRGADGPAAPVAAHIDGAARSPSARRFVSVIAATCVMADALTKVVMARGARSVPVLRHYGARALMSEGAHGWRELK